eukprot:COSAG03_NODE_642_length_6535_cov_21.663611_3_plen_211_part_00
MCLQRTSVVSGAPVVQPRGGRQLGTVASMGGQSTSRVYVPQKKKKKQRRVSFSQSRRNLGLSRGNQHSRADEGVQPATQPVVQLAVQPTVQPAVAPAVVAAQGVAAEALAAAPPAAAPPAPAGVAVVAAPRAKKQKTSSARSCRCVHRTRALHAASVGLGVLQMINVRATRIAWTRRRLRSSCLTSRQGKLAGITLSTQGQRITATSRRL